jgi:adenylate cyclase
LKKKQGVSRNSFFSWLIVMIPIVILVIAFINNANHTPAPKAQKGLLNLSDYDFHEHGNIRLDGEWEFYWNQLLTPDDFNTANPAQPSGYIHVPGIWNGYNLGNIQLSGQGYATFRLLLQLKEPLNLYGLKIITMSNSYNLWVNGELVATNGQVASTKEANIPQYKSQVVSIPASGKRVELVIQVANFYHWKGGVWHPVKFGEFSSIQHERDSRVVLEMFLFGCLFIMAIYHLGAFSLRMADRSLLFFGLVCLVIGLRSLFTGENIIAIVIPGLNWFVARKIEFILTFLSVPAYSAFSRSLYKIAWNKFIYWAIMAVGLGLCLFVLVTPVSIYTFGSYIFTVYSFLSSLYIIFVFTRATIQKQEGAQLFLATSLFFLFTVVNEILNQTEVVHTGLYLPVGLLIVVFAQSYILSLRSANAFKTSEIYSRTFQKFVPRQFLDRVAKEGIESIKPGNAEKGEITVLFSDIRSFTSLSEKMLPDQVFSMLNEYLSFVEPSIRANHGFVDKYMGDGIMALFEKGAGLSSSHQAIQAALEMRDALKTYNQLRLKRFEEPLQVGIGIHTGQVIIGTLGGNERMDSTAIGDPVNLCSRIEGMTKIYGVEILISETSMNLLERPEDFVFRPVDFVVAKGKTEPVGIWEVIGFSTDPMPPEKSLFLETYLQALHLYREKEYKKALGLFETCILQIPGDQVSSIYIERCTQIIQGDLPGDTHINHLKVK